MWKGQSSSGHLHDRAVADRLKLRPFNALLVNRLLLSTGDVIVCEGSAGHDEGLRF